MSSLPQFISVITSKTEDDSTTTSEKNEIGLLKNQSLNAIGNLNYLDSWREKYVSSGFSNVVIIYGAEEGGDSSGLKYFYLDLSLASDRRGLISKGGRGFRQGATWRGARDESWEGARPASWCSDCIVVSTGEDQLL